MMLPTVIDAGLACTPGAKPRSLGTATDETAPFAPFVAFLSLSLLGSGPGSGSAEEAPARGVPAAAVQAPGVQQALAATPIQTVPAERAVPLEGELPPNILGAPEGKEGKAAEAPPPARGSTTVPADRTGGETPGMKVIEEKTGPAVHTGKGPPLSMDPQGEPSVQDGKNPGKTSPPADKEGFTATPAVEKGTPKASVSQATTPAAGREQHPPQWRDPGADTEKGQPLPENIPSGTGTTSAQVHRQAGDPRTALTTDVKNPATNTQPARPPLHAGRSSSIDLSIEPHGLGKIDIRVSLHDGEVRAEFAIEKMKSLIEIQGNMSQLYDSLTKGGLTPGGFSLFLKDREHRRGTRPQGGEKEIHLAEPVKKAGKTHKLYTVSIRV